MKITVTFIFLLVASICVNAQTLITPFAASVSNGEASICQSIGEPVILTVYGNEHLTQGFHQPETFATVDIYLPSVFSPYSSDDNERFKIGLAEDATVFIEEFLIYDRWGNLMYNKTDIDPHTYTEWWDGTYNGKEVENGVYTFLIKYFVRSQSKIAKGSVTKI